MTQKRVNTRGRSDFIIDCREGVVRIVGMDQTLKNLHLKTMEMEIEELDKPFQRIYQWNGDTFLLETRQDSLSLYKKGALAESLLEVNAGARSAEFSEGFLILTDN